jgi:hypothetical protein
VLPRYLAIVLIFSLNFKGGRMRRSDGAKQMTSLRENRLGIDAPLNLRDEVPAVEEAS